MTHGRVQLPSIAVLGAVAAAALASCEPDHNRDVPGPPKIISAYVGTADYTGLPVVAVGFGGSSCAACDPRSWGGNFFTRPDPTMPPVPVRCVPDVLHPPDAMNPIDHPSMGFPYNTAVRLVFSEGLNGDKIEDQDNVTLTAKLKDGVITASGPMGSTPISINNGQNTSMGGSSFYDPGGADFKQGIYGTAPPGPAIMVVPGTGDAMGANGLPSGGMTKICTTSLVTDVAGNAVDPAANCVDIPTSSFAVSSSMPMDGDSVPSAMVSAGITVTFNAPPDTATSNLSAANFALKVAGTVTVPPMCYSIMIDRTMDSLTANLAPTGAAGCPAAIPPGPATLTISANTKDQYRIALMTDKVIRFTVTAGGGDAGEP